jgi:membrane protease YdiL (CAAX protease family)
MPSVFLLLIGLLFLGCVGCWMSLTTKRGGLEDFLEHEPRQSVPWGLIDVFAIAGIAILLELAAVEVARTVFGVSLPLDDSPSTSQWMISLSCITTSRLLAFVAAIAYLVFRNRANSDNLGWSATKFASDTTIGAVAFLLLAAPIFTIQFTLTSLLNVEERHPLIEQLTKDSNSTAFALATFMAVVAAPFTEEFFFRCVLQGWLEKLASNKNQGVGLLIGDSVTAADNTDSDAVAFEPAEALPPRESTRFENDESNPYLASNLVHPSSDVDASAAPKISVTWWPIIVSSLFFAAVHIGHGPDPIPLFVLALGLGYVYQRTHRLWPCIVIHMLLNGVSMFMLWLAIQFEISV